MKKILLHPIYIRLFNWEYWSFAAVYFWTIPAWLFFCLRSRSLFFFSASNPSIENGGLIGESKKDIHRILPAFLFPRTIHFPCNIDINLVIYQLNIEGLSFPLIGKPDIGGKGRGVKLLHNENDVKRYAEKALLDFHIQEYIDFPNEVGIFYYRLPGTEKGRITGIVSKQFLSVTGNGINSIQELMKNNSRGIIYFKSMEATSPDQLQEIAPDGKVIVVSPYGNHARGAKFLDYSHWCDQELLETIDTISNQIPGFYYGRFDIRYKSWDQLKKGNEFMIIELNGAGAEPTHMYDPRHSIFFAWKEIIRHWNILEKISRKNHANGIPYLSFRQGIKIFREYKEISVKQQA